MYSCAVRRLSEIVEFLPCNACELSKSIKYDSRNAPPEPKHVVNVIYVDVGTVSPLSIYGNKYFFIAIAGKARYRVLKCAASKHEVEHFVTALLRRWVNLANGRKPKKLHFDGGPEFQPEFLQRYTYKNGIRLFRTTPFSSFINGKAERSIRVMNDIARTVYAQLPNLPFEL